VVDLVKPFVYSMKFFARTPDAIIYSTDSPAGSRPERKRNGCATNEGADEMALVAICVSEPPQRRSTIELSMRSATRGATPD
jgi:hypothetical protein